MMSAQHGLDVEVALDLSKAPSKAEVDGWVAQARSWFDGDRRPDPGAAADRQHVRLFLESAFTYKIDDHRVLLSWKTARDPALAARGGRTRSLRRGSFRWSGGRAGQLGGVRSDRCPMSRVTSWMLAAALIATAGAPRSAAAKPHDHHHEAPAADGPTEAPPPPKDEAVHPRRGYVWVRGRYQWRHGAWKWTAGHFQRHKRGKRWTDGHWDARGGTYAWTDGAWTDAPRDPDRPPPARPEPEPKARRGYVWIAGHYEWHEGFYDWVRGRFMRRPAWKVWTPGHWDRRGATWAWTEGAWADAPREPIQRPAAGAGRGQEQASPRPGLGARPLPVGEGRVRVVRGTVQEGAARQALGGRGHWDQVAGTWTWTPGAWR